MWAGFHPNTESMSSVGLRNHTAFRRTEFPRKIRKLLEGCWRCFLDLGMCSRESPPLLVYARGTVLGRGHGCKLHKTWTLVVQRHDSHPRRSPISRETRRRSAGTIGSPSKDIESLSGFCTLSWVSCACASRSKRCSSEPSLVKSFETVEIVCCETWCLHCEGQRTFGKT